MPNTREKLIESLERSIIHDGTGREMRFTGGDVTPVVLRAKQEWISVKDRLPEKECRCLVCTKSEYGSGVDIAGYCIEPTPKGIFYPDEMVSGFVIDLRTTHGVCVAINEIVTHWMPLPEPPKGE